MRSWSAASLMRQIPVVIGVAAGYHPVDPAVPRACSQTSCHLRARHAFATVLEVDDAKRRLSPRTTVCSRGDDASAQKRIAGHIRMPEPKTPIGCASLHQSWISIPRVCHAKAHKPDCGQNSRPRVPDRPAEGFGHQGPLRGPTPVARLKRSEPSSHWCRNRFWRRASGSFSCQKTHGAGLLASNTRCGDHAPRDPTAMSTASA
jgi:hypothetical protein